MKVAHSSQRGAFGLELDDGGKEMIDAPMLKQVGFFGAIIWDINPIEMVLM
jgi:hypothetical protein